MTELRRLLAELENLPPLPPDWARFRFDFALQAAEDGRFRDAYQTALWNPETVRRRMAGTRLVVDRPPSLADYRERLDVIPVLRREPPARH